MSPGGVWGRSPQKPYIYTNNFQLSNAFLRRFVAESILHLPLSPQKTLRICANPMTQHGRGSRDYATASHILCADKPDSEHDVSGSVHGSGASNAEQRKRDCFNVFYTAISSQHHRLQELFDIQPFQRFSRRRI